MIRDKQISVEGWLEGVAAWTTCALIHRELAIDKNEVKYQHLQSNFNLSAENCRQRYLEASAYANSILYFPTTLISIGIFIGLFIGLAIGVYLA